MVAPPKARDLIGAGATHGELCVRFAAEDLREPIIHDNVLDDDMLRDDLDNHRLEPWFMATLQAVQRAMQDAQQQLLLQQQELEAFQEREAQEQEEQEEQQTSEMQQATAARQVDGEQQALPGADNGVKDLDMAEAPGSDQFEGDTESLAGKQPSVET